MKVKLKECSVCKKETILYKRVENTPYCKNCYFREFPSKKKVKVKKKIKPRSDKRIEEDKIYKVLNKKFLENNPECQVKLPGCTFYASAVHHLYSGASRSKYYLIVEEWLAICSNCHHIIHDILSMEEAIELGLKKIE